MDAVIRRFGFKFGFKQRIGPGKSYEGDIKELFWNLYKSKTWKGYRIFIGRGIYHISSSSTRSCDWLLGLQKDMRLVKVKGFG